MLKHRSQVLAAVLLSSTSLILAACGEDDGPAPAPADVVDVLPFAETAPVISTDDAADDPAIWVNPEDPAKSLIVGTDKKYGLIVYNLDGEIVFENKDGRMNNVDLRAGYPITSNDADPSTAVETIVVSATNRTDKTIAVYAMDPVSGELSNILDEPIPSNFDDPYGLCMYRSAVNGNLYVFANSKDGVVSQWQLYDSGRGTLRGTIQRTWKIGSQPEGCVADDVNGVLYIGEEAVGVWRYGAEPKDSFDEREQIAATGLGQSSGGRLSADVEGLSLYIPDPEYSEAGYLVASSQGNFTYVVYDRAPPHAYRGTFQVVDNTARGVDGSQETDGLDVVAAPVGPDYPQGLLVVQDGFNKTPDGSEATQNFKLISWAAIADALGLE